MVKGGKFDLVNSTKIKDSLWKIGDKTYTGRGILDNIDSMPMDDVIGLLNKFKPTVVDNMTKEWVAKYGVDLLKSSGRMLIGTAAMNVATFKSGAFDDMDPAELWTHIAMGAVMTRSRGHWGHEAQHNYLADLNPYYDALELINIDSKGLKNLVKTHENGEITNRFASSMATHSTANDVWKFTKNMWSSDPTWYLVDTSNK